MPLYTPLNNASAVLESVHTSGSGTAVLVSVPAVMSGATLPFRVTVFDATNKTIFGVTAINVGTKTLTLSAPLEGTSDFTYAAGSKIECRLTGGALLDIHTELADRAEKDVANTFLVGPQIIQTGDVGNKALILRAIGSQTANLQDWQNASNTVMSHMDSKGNLVVNTINSAASLRIGSLPGSESTYVGIWTGTSIASPSASNYNFLADSTGNSYLNSVGTNTGIYFRANNMTSMQLTKDLGVAIGYNASIDTTTSLMVQPGGTNYKGLVVKGLVSQSANLSEWQNSTGTVMVLVSSAGKLQVNGNAGGTAIGPIVAQSVGDGNPGTALTLDASSNTGGKRYSFLATGTGASGGAGDFAVFNGTDNSYVFRVNYIGQYQCGNSIHATGYLGQVTVVPNAIDVKGIVIRSRSGQTGNLQEWQNSDGTTVYVLITSAGHLTFADGVNLVAGTTTGTKIGTSSTQKIGFFNATPVVQPAANADTSGATLADLETEVNQLKALLRSLGLMAA